MSQKNNPAAIVFGSSVNTLSIISELYELGVKDIVLIRNNSYLASYSRMPIKKIKVEYTDPEKLKTTLFDLRKEYDYLVLFPTADIEIEILHQIYDDISGFCFIPFNKDNVISASSKTVQYEYCEKLGVPYPKTIYLEATQEIEKIKELTYPVIIKPTTRKDYIGDVFRNLVIERDADYDKNFDLLSEYIEKGIVFLVSEIIPGDGSNIYAYVGYRNMNGEILNEWTGKKLSQYPDDFGVFASGSNEAPDKVRELGRTLIEGMNLMGINEPEFKYDSRDGQYKLMEINLRSMMWHRVGNLSGVNIQYTQWADALGIEFNQQTQIKNKKIHFCYLQHELINVCFRKKYFKIFKHNIFGGNKTYLGDLQHWDIMPFLYNTLLTFLRIIKRCLRS